MKIRIKKTNTTLYIALFSIMPIVDAISGFMQKNGYRVNAGQMYRIACFTILAILAVKLKNRMCTLVMIFYVLILPFQILLGSPHIMTVFSNVTRLVTPLLMVFCFAAKAERNQLDHAWCERLLENLTIIYPIILFVSRLFGFVGNAYIDGSGSKGVFYAVNEISFVLCVISLYCTEKLIIGKMQLKGLIWYGVVLFSLLLMGTKSGLFIIAVNLMYLLFYKVILQRKNASKFLKVVFSIAGLLLFAYFAMRLSGREFDAIVQRWKYQRTYVSSSLFDFLSSGRLRRLRRGVEQMFNSKYGILFGWGMCLGEDGRISTEMDLADIFLGTGLAGLMFVFFSYFYYWKNFSKKNLNFNVYNIVLLIVIVFQGHVLYSGMSGMMWGIWLIYTMKDDLKMIAANQLNATYSYGSIYNEQDKTHMQRYMRF